MKKKEMIARIEKLEQGRKRRWKAALRRLYGELMETAELEVKAFKERRKINVIQQMGEAIGRRILSEQEGIEDIVERAVAHSQGVNTNGLTGKVEGNHSSRTKTTAEEEQWIGQFQRRAGEAREDMLKEIWARILATEMHEPGSIAGKTMEVVATVDKTTAEDFQKACSLAIRPEWEGLGLDKIWISAPRMARSMMEEIIHELRVPDIGDGLGNNSLIELGLSYAQLTHLADCGLLRTELNASYDYTGMIAIRDTVAIPLRYQDERYGGIRKDSGGSQGLRITGVGFTQAGRELSKIVEVTKIPELIERLGSKLEKEGFILTKIK